MMGMVKLVGSLDLATIYSAVLVIYSPGDQVVDPEATARTFSAMGSPRKEIISFWRSQDPSQHVLAGDILSPGTTDVIADMIYRFIKPKKMITIRHR